MPDPLIRNISDTARWAAPYRAPKLSGPTPSTVIRSRGDWPASAATRSPRSMAFSEESTWAWVTRTVLFDRFVSEQVRAGVDMVVNLAAGLDARPYRMDLPPTLQWIEIDLPEILAYKEEILTAEKPKCRLERIRLDLVQVDERQEVFAQLGSRSKNALIITEGLIIYLTAEQVGELAVDLAKQPSFRHWVTDLCSPGLLEMLQKNLNPHLAAANAPLKFGPEEGPPFFEKFGWKPTDIRSLLKNARRIGRLSFGMRLLSYLPESHGKQGKRPWSGVLLLDRFAGG